MVNMSGHKKSLLPISMHTLLAVVFIINGIWLGASMIGMSTPFKSSETLQLISIGLAVFASIYGGIHIIAIKFRHSAVKSLL